MPTDSFASIATIASVMTGYPHPWWVAGGWAINLFLGRVTREHGDLEIGVFREHQLALRGQLSGWSLSRCTDGKWARWEAGDWVAPPDFQLIAAHRDRTPSEFDIFLDDLIEGQWRCRRCPAILLPIDGFTLTATVAENVSPVRFLRPEVQLLYKAKYHRPKDESDFELALSKLSGEQRRWLVDNLRLCYTDDPWIDRL